MKTLVLLPALSLGLTLVHITRASDGPPIVNGPTPAAIPGPTASRTMAAQIFFYEM